MTSDEHRKQSAQMCASITRARTAAKAAQSLHDKLSKLAEVKELEAQLRQHRLNYFDLVAA